MSCMRTTCDLGVYHVSPSEQKYTYFHRSPLTVITASYTDEPCATSKYGSADFTRDMMHASIIAVGVATMGRSEA